jgi:hypothetical protein
LCQILKRSYWRRLWIVQEIVVVKMPRVVHLLCGSSHAYFIPLRLLASANQDLTRTITIHTLASESWTRTSQRVNELAQRVLLIAQHGESWHELLKRDESSIGMLELLRDHSESLCSNPRDKVYALLGISLPYHGIELDISYSVSVSQVYSNVAQYIICGSKRLDILLFCNRFRSDQYTLPSWIPDWLHYDAHGTKIMTPSRDHMDHKSYESSPAPIASFSADGKVLTARAALLGTIRDIYRTRDWIATVRGVNRLTTNFVIAGKTELFRCLNFAISSLQLAAEPNNISSSISSDIIKTNLSENTIKMFYETILYSYHGAERSRSIWPFHKFLTFCHRIHLIGMMQTADDIEWSEQDTCKLLLALDLRKWLFSVTIPVQMESNIGSEDTAVFSRAAIGHCPRNARIGDVAAVILGCKQPVLLRKTGKQYELVGAIYLREFMDEETVKLLPHVDIELI